MFLKEMQMYVSCELFESYIERLESWMHLSKVRKQDRVHVLICMLNSTDYGTLRKLCHPNRPAKLGYKTCVKLLSNHFDDHQQVIVSDGQSTESESQSSEEDPAGEAEHIIGSVRLVTSTEHGQSPEDCLSRRMPETSSTCSQPAIDHRDTRENWRKPSGVRESLRYFAPKAHGVCNDCGNLHSSNYCFARDKLCFACGGRGHLARMCPTKNRRASNDLKHSSTQYSKKPSQLPSIKVNVNGAKIRMSVNPASKHSYISNHLYKKYLASKTLHSTRTKFCHSKKSSFSVIGKIYVQFTSKYSCHDLSIKVVDALDDCDPVIGQDWMQQIDLNWSKIFNTFYSGTSK
jgi:hypothetical protein